MFVRRASERNFTSRYEDRYRSPSCWFPRRNLHSFSV